MDLDEFDAELAALYDTRGRQYIFNRLTRFSVSEEVFLNEQFEHARACMLHPATHLVVMNQSYDIISARVSEMEGLNIALGSPAMALYRKFLNIEGMLYRRLYRRQSVIDELVNPVSNRSGLPLDVIMHMNQF